MQKLTNRKEKTVRGPWNYFNDCHICQGMKQGRGNTMEDLKKLFSEARNKEVNIAENEIKQA